VTAACGDNIQRDARQTAAAMGDARAQVQILSCELNAFIHIIFTLIDLGAFVECGMRRRRRVASMIVYICSKRSIC
jgi:hypothetical protein